MTSTDLPWFRFYKDAVDDEKLALLAKEDRWDYVALLCCKAKGILDGNADLEMTRLKVGVKLGVTQIELEQIERRLVHVGLIEPRTLQPIAWDKRQFKSDASTGRVRKHRERLADGDEADSGRKHTYSEEFEHAWSLYPKRPGANKLESFKAWNARLAQQVTPEEMMAGVRRYAAYCVALETEQRFIKQPATFFGPNQHYTADWTPPRVAPTAPTARSERNAAWMGEMTGNQGGNDVRSGDFIDVTSRRV